MSFTGSQPISGGGALILPPGSQTVTIAQPIEISAITVQGGTLSLSTNIEPGTLTVSGGVITGDGSVTIGSGGGQFTFSGGRVDGSVGVLIEPGASFTWSGGTMGGSGVTTIASGATMTLPAGGAPDIAGARTLDTAGTVTQACDLRTEGGAITSAGTWTLQGDVSFVPFAPAPVTFTNTGTLTKASGTGTSTLAQVLDNSGTIDLTSGTLATRTFTQTSSGVLLLQLTGSTPGSSFGVLAVNGTAALSGTLQITDPGYQPPLGSAYPFLTYQASNGVFTAVDGPVGGPAFSITYGPASVAAAAGR